MFDVKKGVYGENFIDEATAATSVTATRGVCVGGVFGRVKARLVAGEGGLSVANAGALTLTATQADDIDGEYAAYSPALTKTYTASAAETYNEGDIILELDFPSDTKMYAKIAFSMTASAATGKIKVVPAAV